MQVSFSRKGFDSSNGTQPNAILPDGTLIPFPIPDTTGLDTYGNIVSNGKSYFEIISELNPRTSLKPTDHCHLDPDLIRKVKPRKDGWTAAFGQADQSLSELRNKDFGCGDLFLFFGWFRETEFINGRLQYKRKRFAPDIQLIYGYMQVGDILTAESKIPNWLLEHPHSSRLLAGSKKDAIFLPSKHLSFDEMLPGAGILRYSPELVLTAPGMSRSRWQLPKCINTREISHAGKQPANGEYFQSALIGQEMIWECESEEAFAWIKKVCSHVIAK